ncbi:substrate-binding domain-containing protein [Kocuria sediminis]|uniref:substrate-binding domain-containing protein n=1 Tax=Kocuria sediminis TaxID=1038857 RepID=UPI001390A38A
MATSQASATSTTSSATRYQNSHAAAHHLLSQGARSILYFEEALAISTIAHRQKGFTRAMPEVPEATSTTIHLPTRRFENTGPQWRAEEAYRACTDLITSGAAFDAIATGDDYFALGVLKALAEHDIHAPDEVQAVRYGGLPFAPWTSPALTSVKLPARLIGELAVSMLLQRLAGDTSTPIERLIKPELVVRSSSGTRKTVPK